MYLGLLCSRYPLKALSLVVLPVLSGSVVFQLLKFTVAGILYKVNAGSGLIYDLGRKARAEIKAQAGSDQ